MSSLWNWWNAENIYKNFRIILGIWENVNVTETLVKKIRIILKKFWKE